MVCAVTTSTLAGVSMTGSPKRLALCATALSGVIGIPASALGFDPATLPGTGGVDTGLGAEGIPITPLNAVAQSASRLGLPVIQTPASVDVVTAQTIQDQGYRTTTDTAQGAVGVLSGDAGGAPANFSMRGFSFGEINTLYNGIWTGPS